MTDRVFVDSNVWVYAVDADEPAKQARARAVLDPTTSDTLVTSAQVLGEFYVTVTRKLARPVADDIAARMVDRMAQLPIVAIDADGVHAAITGSRSWQLSYWDALIVVAAQSAGCSRLLSEDLADGTTYGSVRVENPFVEKPRVSETRPGYGALRGPWDDADLLAQLARYEEACRAAGMRQNAIHSYWDYARRFLAWRVGDYRPRGATGRGRPVPAGPVSTADLERQAASYARAIEAAGREQATVDTYHRHAMFFIRWLRGDFAPGRRLRLRDS
jgi:predicted nucleic acid-binding protein